MDRRQIAAILTLDKLGIEATLEDFPNRLSVQKATYLAQAAGINLGYYYSWYLRGPYSPALTKDLYSSREFESELASIKQRWALDTESNQRLDRLRPLVSRAAEAGSDQARRLELLASVHFLIDRAQVASRNAGEIAGRLQQFGKNFSADEVDDALRELVNHGIIDQAANR